MPFLLLVDTDKIISTAYGAGSSGYPKRITFIIGKDGKVAYSNLNVNANIKGHASEIVRELEKLAK